MSAGEIAGISIEAALEQVRIAFAERPMPVHATYCSCCHDDAEMQRILHSPPADVSSDEFCRMIWDAYWTGVDWSSLAYYIPEMLARFELYGPIEEDMLLHKLLVATHPEVYRSLNGEGMKAAEKEAIGGFFQTVLDERLHIISYHEHKETFRDLLAFLIHFDNPIAPLLERWRQTTDRLPRINLCLFTADYLLHYHDSRRGIYGTYYDGSIAPLPENQAALDALMRPEDAANLLMECAGDAETVGADWETGIGAAFDWAMTRARQERGNGT